MENSEKVLYEYFLNDGEVRQMKCDVISQMSNRRKKKMFEFKRANMYGSKWISEDELGIIHNNHIYTFENDVEKYRELFIKYIEDKVKKQEKQLYKNKKILKTLVASVGAK